MAVPRTHDGSVGPRSTSSIQLVLTVVFAVVAVACLVILGIRYASTDQGSVGARVEQMFSSGDEGADKTRTRELVMSQANQFVLRINNYGPGDLDDQNKLPGYGASVREVITSKFAADFDEQGLPLAEQAVSQTGYARTAKLTATGTESLSDTNASVLVAGSFTGSYPDPAAEAGDTERVEYGATQFRYQVKLVRTQGKWLVDDFVPVTGQDDAVAPGAESPITDAFAQIIGRRNPGARTAIAEVATCGFPDPATDPACLDAVTALAQAALPLQRALQGAANPDSQVFVGTPPDAIADLVDGTRDAAEATVVAAGRVADGCLSADTPRCTQARRTLVLATSALTSALDLWEPYR